jgi:Fe-Mn family superoxide dismutase
MSDIKNSEVANIIKMSLGVDTSPSQNSSKVLNENYVAQPKQFDLNTEFLSQKNKGAHKELYDNYIDTFNRVSAELDTVNREEANLNHSAFRSLKVDESYNLNALWLHELYFSNISDLRSEIAMDSIPYMRLERDFGSFDAWQKDFIACALSARNGWVVTGYHMYLQRYVNTVVDLHSLNHMIGIFPVVVMDVWEHAYYRDYLKDRKTYVYAMMKELNWTVIGSRFSRAEKIHKAMRG